MVKSIKCALTVPLFLALFFAACSGGKNGAELKKEVSVAGVEKKDISKEVMLIGSIEAKDFAEIFPRGSGKVVKKLLNEGDPVKKGQTIMTSMRDEVGFTFRPAPIVSTIDGFIGRIFVDVGSSVETATPVATVVRPDEMRLKIDMPEIYIADIEPGEKVSFFTDAVPGEKFEGLVTTVSKAIDLKNRTTRVELMVDNPDHKLVHGMFAKIDMPIETHEAALTVPLDAISWEAEKQFVFKVTGNKLVKSRVKTGIRNAVRVEIVEGLNEGDLVVVGDLINLKDGEEVNVAK